MSIVTKQGDKGRTRLYSGEEISKSDIRLNAYGTVDELVSHMGLARAMANNREVSEIILKNQEILFRLGSELATRNYEKVKLNIINQKDVRTIEDQIKGLESRTELPKNFIIPGNDPASAAIDLARTVCRRLERLLVELSETGAWKNSSASIYINRLSDLLFMLEVFILNFHPR